jgi:sugar phosphate isomerase/epimerase
MKNIKLCLQLFTLREEMSKNPENAIKQAAELGYDGVELYGYSHLKITAEQYKEWLDKYGLYCCGINSGWDDILPENIGKLMDFCRTVGTTRIAVGSAPVEMLGKRSKMPYIIDTLNTAYETLTANGFQTGYHAHYTDFVMVDGVSVWDRIFQATPEDFYMILDTGNAEGGGGNSMHLIEKYPNRMPWAHLKPYHVKLGACTVMGEDSYDWYQLIKNAIEIGNTDTFVIEHSCANAYTAYENAKICYDYTKKILEELK